MRLHPKPFSLMKNGDKTIELRLYDEKRRLISVGDEIEFINTSMHEDRLLCEVLDVHLFASFKELYDALPLLKCGYTKENLKNASYIDMKDYYTSEEEAKYGVVGIELKIL